MKNIESFNIAVAEVFGKCYQAFPIRIDVSVIDVGEAIHEALGPGYEHDIYKRNSEYDIARASINWLIESGYLLHRNDTHISFNAVTLSPKGLEVLNAKPKELQIKATLGEELSKGVKVIGKDAALSFVKTALSYGAKLVLDA
jgi:hypothetical protein